MQVNRIKSLDAFSLAAVLPLPYEALPSPVLMMRLHGRYDRELTANEPAQRI